jgi:actin-related protein
MASSSSSTPEITQLGDDVLEGIVFDFGTARTKAGLVPNVNLVNGADIKQSYDTYGRHLSVQFDTVVGRRTQRGLVVGLEAKDAWIGAEAISKRNLLTLKNPMERGM